MGVGCSEALFPTAQVVHKQRGESRNRQKPLTQLRKGGAPGSLIRPCHGSPCLVLNSVKSQVFFLIFLTALDVSLLLRQGDGSAAFPPSYASNVYKPSLL